MLTRRDTLLDERGTRRRVLSMREAAKPLGIKPTSLSRPGDHAKFKTEFIRNWLLPAAITIAVVAAYATIRGFFNWESLLFGSFAVLVGMSFSSLVVSLYSYIYIWKSAEHGRDALLASGLCPSCGYGIAGVRCEADGCTVCPECSAAWRMECGPDGRNAPGEAVTNGL